MRVTAEEIKKEAKALAPEILRDRRRLHQCPEVGTELPATCAYIRQRLEEMGIPLAGLRGRTAGKNDRGLPDRRLSPDGAGHGPYALSSAGENPVFSCGRTWTPCPSGKKTTFPSGPPEPVLTCAATTAMPPCCWVRPGS